MPTLRWHPALADLPEAPSHRADHAFLRLSGRGHSRWRMPARIVGADVPDVDGILFEAGRVWAVQNLINQVTELRLSPDLSSATVERVITSPLIEVPTTVARDGNRLAIVNAKFDTGFPPTAASYEVVILSRR